MDDQVDVTSSTDVCVRFACIHCGLEATAVVRGVGEDSRSQQGYVAPGADERAARRGAEAMADANAMLTAGLARCPRCGGRHPAAVRRFWTFTLATLALAAIAAAGIAFALFAWLGPQDALFAWLFAAGAVIGLPTYYLLHVRWQWTTVDDRVAFPSLAGEPMPGRAPPQLARLRPTRSTDKIGPWLMLCFGVLALAYGGWEVTRLQRNPAPLDVGCEAAAIETIELDRWIRVHGCRLDLDQAIVVERDGDPQALLAALVPAESTTPTPPVAYLRTREYRILERLETLADSDDLGAEVEAITAVLQAIGLDPVDGTTGRDIPVGSWRERAKRPDERVVTIEPGNEPKRSTVVMTLVGALILLSCAAIYWPRRRWTHEVIGFDPR